MRQCYNNVETHSLYIVLICWAEDFTIEKNSSWADTQRLNTVTESSSRKKTNSQQPDNTTTDLFILTLQNDPALLSNVRCKPVFMSLDTGCTNEQNILLSARINASFLPASTTSRFSSDNQNVRSSDAPENRGAHFMISRCWSFTPPHLFYGPLNAYSHILVLRTEPTLCASITFIYRWLRLVSLSCGLWDNSEWLFVIVAHFWDAWDKLWLIHQDRFPKKKCDIRSFSCWGKLTNRVIPLPAPLWDIWMIPHHTQLQMSLCFCSFCQSVYWFDPYPHVHLITAFSNCRHHLNPDAVCFGKRNLTW